MSFACSARSQAVRQRELGSRRREEVRLVREFAHHVDGILVFLQDVLMPRKLEAHLDDGFEAVREALRRRILRDGGERVKEKVRRNLLGRF